MGYSVPEVPGNNHIAAKSDHDGSCMGLENYLDQLYVYGRRVVLYTSGQQMYGRRPCAGKIFQEISSQQPLNLDIRDVLAARQCLVPSGWKRYKAVLFWSTIIFSRQHELFVGCLSLDATGNWTAEDYCLDDLVDNTYPAACLEI